MKTKLKTDIVCSAIVTMGILLAFIVCLLLESRWPENAIRNCLQNPNKFIGKIEAASISILSNHLTVAVVFILMLSGTSNLSDSYREWIDMKLRKSQYNTTMIQDQRTEQGTSDQQYGITEQNRGEIAAKLRALAEQIRSGDI